MTLTEIRNHLGKFRVGIAGAGGLGSNCAVALARSGIGTLVIADFDKVEPANLNRQYYFADQTGLPKTEALKYNISRIDLTVKIIAHNEKLDKNNIPEIFKNCDIIVEAFDLAEMKEMLVETVIAKLPGVPVVVGSGMGGYGASPEIKYKKIDDTLYICGDETSEVSESMPPMAPRVGMVANMQANTVIEILMSKNR